MKSTNIIHSWPHQWYGFWRSEAHDYDDLPQLQAAIDFEWNPDDKKKMIEYLQRSPIVMSSMSKSTCLLCNVQVPTLCYHSDGKWFWPDSLGHYVSSHNIALPDSFADSIRDRGYTPPQDSDLPDVAVRDLPWPASWVSMRNLSW